MGKNINSIIIREPQSADKENFLSAMKRSETLHHPWVKPPLTPEEFEAYLAHLKQGNKKSFFACDQSGNIVGVYQ